MTTIEQEICIVIIAMTAVVYREEKTEIEIERRNKLKTWNV